MIKNYEKAAIVAPYMGGFDRQHIACVMHPELAGVAKVSCHGMSILDQTRSYLAQQALDHTKADVFLWVDDDVLFTPEAVESIVEQCLDEHPIIAGAYATKRAPDGFITAAFAESVKEVGWFEQGGIYPLQACGMGFTAIHREVFENIGNTLPEVLISSCLNYPAKPYFQCLIVDGKWKGEDHSFIYRAHELGYQTVCDTRIRLQHRGLYNYSIEDVVAPVRPQVSFRVGLDHGKK
jgi:hypothetical protein